MEQALGIRDREARAVTGDFWALGDYAAVAPRLQPVAEELVETAEVQPGARVLDVAAGNGNVAIAAAARGARVEACDLSPAMVEAGRARTTGLDVHWTIADAHALPYEDATMDAALSAFGVMFASDPDRATSELFRVVRPGGAVALANWTPSGFTAATSELLSRYLPPPEGPHPLAWGDPILAGARFAAHGADVQLHEREVVWRFDDMRDAVEWFEKGFAYDAVRRSAEPARYAELLARLQDIIARDADGDVLLRPRYLIVRATRRRT
jgi:SAM-dependent methyltransferase